MKILFRCVLLASFITVGFTLGAGAQSSHLSVEATVPINQIQALVERKLDRSFTIDRQRGSHSTKVKFKYPCFKGIKMYSCDGWTKGPTIHWEAWGNAHREGVSITPIANGLQASSVFHASVTGKNNNTGLRETVRGSAQITIHSQPVITSAYRIQLNLNASHHWHHKPTAKLLGFIPLTFGSEADKAINKHKPKLLRSLDDKINASAKLRSRLETQLLPELSHGIEISQSPSVWLKGSLQELYAPQITTTAHDLKLRFGLKAALTITNTHPTGSKPATISAPALKSHPNNSNHIDAQAVLQLDLNQLYGLLEPELKKHIETLKIDNDFVQMSFKSLQDFRILQNKLYMEAQVGLGLLGSKELGFIKIEAPVSVDPTHKVLKVGKLTLTTLKGGLQFRLKVGAGERFLQKIIDESLHVALNSWRSRFLNQQNKRLRTGMPIKVKNDAGQRVEIGRLQGTMRSLDLTHIALINGQNAETSQSQRGALTLTLRAKGSLSVYLNQLHHL